MVSIAAEEGGEVRGGERRIMSNGLKKKCLLPCIKGRGSNREKGRSHSNREMERKKENPRLGRSRRRRTLHSLRDHAE